MSILLDLKPTAFQIGEILAGKRLFRNRYLSGPFHHNLAAGFCTGSERHSPCREMTSIRLGLAVVYKQMPLFICLQFCGSQPS